MLPGVRGGAPAGGGVIGHLAISRGAALADAPADSVVVEYEPPQGQPVRLAVIEHADVFEDRRVIPIEITCGSACGTDA